ncbi:hypothetical protein R1sor_023302 [Riccia sorocarpa]|uniref:SWIM-type domain-containing protein n=1 Tax=Riccia sorocarpa TaxID=122646 RepID=A0ABD3GNS8_9MARC
MDACAQLFDPLFLDIQLVPTEPDGTITVSAQFCVVRWKLQPSSVYINERREILDRQATVLVNQSKPGFWVLKAGLSYIVFGTAADSTPLVVRDEVSQLPDSYDGNLIFELPPSSPEELSKKGVALVGMDRGNDCWLWTKCITTSAQIGGRKSLYSVNKIRCVGSLKCENDSCPYLLSEGVANVIDWPDKVHREKPYDVGEIVPLKSHVCGHCNTPSRCVSSCPAKMYYILPKQKLDIDEVLKMSRVAIHSGQHSHPHRRVASRSHVKAMRDEVTDTMNKSPHLTPSQVRAGVSQSMFSKLLEGLKDRLGTTNAFEKAFDIAVRQTDPLRNIPHTINGDINTTTYKRKGPAISTIRSGDTHRHDRVAIISQVTRRVKARLQFDFTTTHSIPEEIPVPTTHTPEDMDGSSYFQAHEHDAIHAENATESLQRQDTPDLLQTPQVGDAAGSFSLQQDLNHESPDQHDAAHPPEQLYGMANTNITDLSSQTELRQSQAQASQRTHPIDAHPRTDQDSNDDVVVLRVTPRARPPTRAFPINVPTLDEMVDQVPVGVLQNGQAVVEQDVDKRFWHLSRIHPSGNPACNAAMTGRGAPRSLCKTKIKVSGRTVKGVATVAPSFVGYTKFQGVEKPRQFWFCPSMTCLSAQGSIHCKFQKPRVPEVMPVLTGTDLSQEEVDFLTERGIQLVHQVPRTIPVAIDQPSVLDIQINVDAYPQKVISAAPDFHFQARGTKPCRRKTSPSGACSKKLQRARTTTMMLTGSWSVSEGNGYGRMYRISTHLNADVRSYIVQLCCFPTCSCGEFFERESRRSSFFPCKHIYWIYLNVLGLRPDANIMHQPVFSKNEVDKLVSMETMTTAARERVVFG